MTQFNLEYRGKNKPTDVLSFPQTSSLSELHELEQQSKIQTSEANENELIFTMGDLLISTEQANIQAQSLGHSLDAEITRLIVHGLLHLCAFDHEKSPQEAKIMLDKEKEILQILTEDFSFVHVLPLVQI